MSSTERGLAAESAACTVLTAQGFVVMGRNYRTRRCEIDIVAQKDGCVYFIEVKYRTHVAQGAGLDYVTISKQRQMRFAAQIWLQNHSWDGEVALAAIEVRGPTFAVSELVPVF
jgi:Holliday junction resolvase-like predicted endonuclease